jgi:hypothetical protein
MTDEIESSRRRIPLWLALLLMALGLLLAALILYRVAGPLYGLLFPLDVPVPSGAHELEHVKPDKGAEYWIYRTSETGESVAAFYEQEGGTCRYTPRPPGEEDFPVEGPYSIAQCTGSKKFAGLGVSWEVYIHAGYSEAEGPTVFRVYKYGDVN